MLIHSDLVVGRKLTTADFYFDLLHEMIDNDLTGTETRRQHEQQSAMAGLAAVPPQKNTGGVPVPVNTHKS